MSMCAPAVNSGSSFPSVGCRSYEIMLGASQTADLIRRLSMDPVFSSSRYLLNTDGQTLCTALARHGLAAKAAVLQRRGFLYTVYTNDTTEKRAPYGYG